MNNLLFNRLPWIAGTILASSLGYYSVHALSPARAAETTFGQAMNRIAGDYRGTLFSVARGGDSHRQTTPVNVHFAADGRSAWLQAKEPTSGRVVNSTRLTTEGENLISSADEWFDCIDLGRFGNEESDRLILSSKSASGYIRHVDFVRLESHLSIRITEGKSLKDLHPKHVYELELVQP